jgi:hypothetical protein
MSVIKFSASPKQLSKLRNGHKVRVKPAVEGMGFSSLIVSPGKFDIITRAFGRGKGSEIQLSAPEILENQEAAPSLEGSGIFGKAGDKVMKKLGIKKIAYKVGDMVKPLVKKALGYGIEAIVDAIVASQPEFAPFRIGAIAVAKNLEEDFLDKPGKYQDALSSRSKAEALIKQKVKDFLIASAKGYATAGMAGQGTPILDQKFSVNDIKRTGKKLMGRGKGTPILDQKFSVNDVIKTGKKMMGRGTPILDQKFSVNDVKHLIGRGAPRSRSAPATLADVSQQHSVLGEINDRLGTKYGALGKANLATALANKESASVIDRTVGLKGGMGLYASGASSGRGLTGYGIMGRSRKCGGQIGVGGNLMSLHSSPAMMSQPYSANFQMANMLPPAYHHLSRGMGLGP